MTDAEISRRLALAIGWPIHLVDVAGVDQDCITRCFVVPEGRYKLFDYRDPAVIWPIAERYKCFPDHCADAMGDWFAWCRRICDFVYADTAAKAVALAVIKANEAAKE